MSDSVAWCILAGFKITSVFSRITYHIIESVCEFVVSILEEYMHRGKRTVAVNVRRKVQKQKRKTSIKLTEAGCQNEESENENYRNDATKPTVTRKNETEDKNGDAITISGQGICFRGTDKVVEFNLREARKVTVTFDFYPLQDQSTLGLYGPSTRDRTTDTQNETTGKVPTSEEPLPPTSSNQISDQPNESEVTRMYGLKCEGGSTLDDNCRDKNLLKSDYKKHTMRHTEAMKVGAESKDKTDSINQRCDASSDKIQENRDTDKLPIGPPVDTKQCQPAHFHQVQGKAAHTDEHAELRQGLETFAYQTVDKKQDCESTGYKVQDPEPTADQKADTKITFKQIQVPDATVDQKDTESTVDKKKYPALTVDPKQGPKAADDEKQGSEAADDEKQGPGAADDETHGPEAEKQGPKAAVGEKQGPKAAVVQKQGPKAAVVQKQGPKAAVVEIQDPGTNIQDIQGQESTVNQKQEPEATLNLKDRVSENNQNKIQEVIVDQRQDVKSKIDQKQSAESFVDQNRSHATVVNQKQDQSAPIDQSPDKKQGALASVEEKSPVDLIDPKHSKVRTLDQSPDKKGPSITVDVKQGAGATFNKKTGDKGGRNRGTTDPTEKKTTVFIDEKKNVSAVPAEKKKGAAFSADTKESLEVTVDKKQGDETVQKTNTAALVERKQGSTVPADKKKSAVSLVDEKKVLEVPVGKKQGSAVLVDQKKDSLSRMNETVDKKKSPAAISSQNQGSAANVYPSTNKKHRSTPSTCKEKVDSKREPGYTSSAADNKSVSKGVKDENNLKGPKGDFRKGEGTLTFSGPHDADKVFESTSEVSKEREIEAFEILSEASRNTSRIAKVPKTSGSADVVESDSEMTRDTGSIEPTSELSKCAEASEKVENFADVSEVSRNDASEVLEDHKADKSNSKTSRGENNGGSYQESLADRFSHQRESTESEDSSTTSDEDSLNNSGNRLEKGPSILIAPDVLLDPNMPLGMMGSDDQTKEKTRKIAKEYLQDEWDDTDKYFYEHVIEREKEMGHIDPSIYAKERPGQNAAFETKNKQEKKESQKEDDKSQKKYGKIVDKFDPMTELPKYYDVISKVDSKYLLEKSEIKCYTKQGVTDDSKIVDSKQNISDAGGSVETEQRNNKRQSTKGEEKIDMFELAARAEAARALEKASGKSFEEMGARPRIYRRHNFR